VRDYERNTFPYFGEPLAKIVRLKAGRVFEDNPLVKVRRIE
jgi:hypothetical protein